jgi:hypothetical protein
VDLSIVTTTNAVTSTTNKKIVLVLLDFGSDSDLIFVDKDKPMLLPSAKKAGSTVMEYFEWEVSDQTKG